jgi:hypothetical protein
VIYAIDKENDTEGSQNYQQKHDYYEQYLDHVAPENDGDGGDEDQDYDFLNMTHATRAAVNCEHIFA